MYREIDMTQLTLWVVGVIFVSSIFPTSTGWAEPGGPRSVGVDAQVEADAPASRVRLQIEAATELPLFVGARTQLVLPFGLHLGAGLGALPDGLLDVTAGVASRVGGLDDASAGLVQQALSDGWMTKVYAGWSPNSGAFYLQVGYGYLGLEGSLTSAQLASLDGLQAVAAFPGTATLSTGVHALEGELGFRWAIDDVRVRLSVGLTAALASNTTFQIEAANLPATEATRLGELAAGAVDGGVERFGYLPTVGLGIGYDLGL